jgi:hypothetical protein
MNTLKVGGGGMAKQCGGHRWIQWRRDRTGKPWLQSAQSQHKRWAKRRKARYERRKSRLDPECASTHNRYQGWDD